jgi:hypothetical protein
MLVLKPPDLLLTIFCEAENARDRDIDAAVIERDVLEVEMRFSSSRSGVPSSCALYSRTAHVRFRKLRH